LIINPFNSIYKAKNPLTKLPKIYKYKSLIKSQTNGSQKILYL